MIYSMGEMLIDFMQEGDVFVPYPGGAPANVAIHAKRAGAKACFVGKLSEDHFGDVLEGVLSEHRVLFPLSRSPQPTALALVSHVKGERSFQFYRNNTADLNLAIADVDTINFGAKDILHFCSLGLVPESTSYEAHVFAIEKCKKAGGLISFDVNLRKGLWASLDLAKERVLSMLSLCDLVKVNEEELLWLSGDCDIEASMRALQKNNQVILCTMGELGSYTLLSDGSLIKSHIEALEPVDTTGAGDSFTAMILTSLNQYPGEFHAWQHNELDKALDHASKVSAQVVSFKGAIPEITY